MNARVSEVMLERYLAGDLAPGALARVERALAADPALRARLDALRAERDAFLQQRSPADFARAVARQVAARAPAAGEPRRAPQKRGPSLAAWWLWGPALAGALVLLIVVRPSRSPTGRGVDERSPLAGAAPAPQFRDRDAPREGDMPLADDKKADGAKKMQPETMLAMKTRAPARREPSPADEGVAPKTEPRAPIARHKAAAPAMDAQRRAAESEAAVDDGAAHDALAQNSAGSIMNAERAAPAPARAAPAPSPAAQPSAKGAAKMEAPAPTGAGEAFAAPPRAIGGAALGRLSIARITARGLEKLSVGAEVTADERVHVACDAAAGYLALIAIDDHGRVKIHVGSAAGAVPIGARAPWQAEIRLAVAPDVSRVRLFALFATTPFAPGEVLRRQGDLAARERLDFAGEEVVLPLRVLP